VNRRRFLKYAGAGAAVVGGSVLGLDYLAGLRSPHTVSRTASMSSVSSATIVPPTVTSVATSAITTTRTSTTETGSVLVWESDFSDGTLDGFKQNASIDLSVGCPNISLAQSDVANYIVDDKSVASTQFSEMEHGWG
jgi:hypothetical protein